MTDEKIKPVAIVAEVHMSRYTLEWTGRPLEEGDNMYSESALAQAREEGRQKGLREAAKLLDDNWYKTQADCIEAITRAAEGKKEWVGLTKEEATELWERIDDRDSWELIMQVQAKLKEKNNG
jgi:flagellar biosynthesis/type III secretory pathway protein FliH